MGGIQFFVLVQWGQLVEAGQFFLNELQKFSYRCYVIIDHHVIHFLYLLASSKQHSILRLPFYFYYRQYAKR